MSKQRLILILGAGGQVGTELQRSFADAGEVIACDRKAADLSRPDVRRRRPGEAGPGLQPRLRLEGGRRPQERLPD